MAPTNDSEDRFTGSFSDNYEKKDRWIHGTSVRHETNEAPPRITVSRGRVDRVRRPCPRTRPLRRTRGTRSHYVAIVCADVGNPLRGLKPWATVRECTQHAYTKRNTSSAYEKNLKNALSEIPPCKWSEKSYFSPIKTPASVWNISALVDVYGLKMSCFIDVRVREILYDVFDFEWISVVRNIISQRHVHLWDFVLWLVTR